MNKTEFQILVSFLLGVMVGIKKEPLEESEVISLFQILEENGVQIKEKALKDIDDMMKNPLTFVLVNIIFDKKHDSCYA